MDSTLVIDNGSGSIKAGLAGSDLPRTFPNLVGRIKHRTASIPTSLEGLQDGNVLVGTNAEKYRALLKLSYPMEHGNIVDYADMGRVWSHTYAGLSLTSDAHPVLLTEPPLVSSRTRMSTAQIFFETYHVPSLSFSVQAVLSLYAQGHVTGVVLDIGDGVTHACPVFEGFTVSNAMVRSDLGGRDVTRYLQLLLRQNGQKFYTSAEFEIVRKIKEEAAYIALSVAKEEEMFRKQPDLGPTYTLPDGTVVALGGAAFQAPEILFTPSTIGLEHQGVHEILLDCIRKSDIDMRRDLFSNVIVAGGSTLFRNFGDRLFLEIKKKSPTREVKVRVTVPPDRKYSTWKGGSLLAQLGTFQQMLIRRKEWEEEGERALMQKSFL